MNPIEHKKPQSPKWYHHTAAFFAGMFLANVVPHYVNGISGNAFPSPFGNPPGLGESSPLSNVLWGAFNLVIGYWLFRFSKTSNQGTVSLLVFFAGLVCQGVILSLAFSR